MNQKRDSDSEESPSRPDRRSIKQKDLAQKFMNALSPEAAKEKN